MTRNEYRHNDDGTTHIFVESKGKTSPGRHTIIIDTEDWVAASKYRWSVTMHNTTVFYAQATIYLEEPEACRIAWREGRQPRRSSLRVHHLVMGKPPKGLEIDHINHNGLDNRKENLRLVTKSQNQQNARQDGNAPCLSVPMGKNKLK